MKCCYCTETKDLRPYGPNHSMICFSCATSTPERDAAAAKNFHTQFDACLDENGEGLVVIDSEIGPYPLINKRTN